jgi:hypothetical protein
VRDVCFNNDGTRFLSTGYDKNIRLWDTETGTCLKSFSTGKVGAPASWVARGAGLPAAPCPCRPPPPLFLFPRPAAPSCRPLLQVFYCVKFHPQSDRQNVFMAGCHDKKIYQFDTDTGAHGAARRGGWWLAGPSRFACLVAALLAHLCIWALPALPTSSCCAAAWPSVCGPGRRRRGAGVQLPPGAREHRYLHRRGPVRLEGRQGGAGTPLRMRRGPE